MAVHAAENIIEYIGQRVRIFLQVRGVFVYGFLRNGGLFGNQTARIDDVGGTAEALGGRQRKGLTGQNGQTEHDCHTGLQDSLQDTLLSRRIPGSLGGMGAGCARNYIFSGASTPMMPSTFSMVWTVAWHRHRRASRSAGSASMIRQAL